MYLILAILAFNIIVIVHELGHFITARKLGIKVLEFSLFIGPKIFSFERGGTTYSIRLFPVMAYVKMLGEEEESDSEQAFNNKPKYARALTAIGGPFANLLLAAVLLTAYFSIQGYYTMEIGQVVENSPAAVAGIQKGDRILSYDGKRTHILEDVIQFLYISKGEPAIVEIERDGERIERELRPIRHPESMEPKIGVSLSSENDADSNVIKALAPGMPAEQIGLQAGDRIVEINGNPVVSSERLVELVKENGMRELAIKAERDGTVVSVTLMPVEVKTEESYDIGLKFIPARGNVIESFGQAASFTYSIIRSVFYSPGWLFSGKAKVSDMMGPIGMVSTITTTVSQAPDIGQMLVYLMYITGLLSVA
ncbi:MAG: RIP metalloprotease RseP, partial [Clostridiaceae bacterium]|nr:RIP metalloprotease RseP [Clostridiaceae bacterium]